MVDEMNKMGFDTSKLEKMNVKRSRSRVADRLEDDEEAQKAMQRKLSHSKKPQKDTENLSEPLKKKARAASQLSQRFMKMTGQRGRGRPLRHGQFGQVSQLWKEKERYALRSIICFYVL